MLTKRKTNNPALYRNIAKELVETPLPSRAIFCAECAEKIEQAVLPYNKIYGDELKSLLDNLDLAIIEELARSKYLTSIQIYQYVRLRGIETNRLSLRSRLRKLASLYVIQESNLVISGTQHSLKYFELDIKGYYIAKEQGVPFHSGNRVVSYCKKAETNIPDEPVEIKRVLAGNQIVLGLLLSNAKMQRFGIMETLRIKAEDGNVNSCIIRTAAVVKIDSDSVLAYEVVRDFPIALEKLADKVDRYYKVLKCQEYLDENAHRDTSFPQLVICGESFDHNLRIAKYLSDKGLWNDEDTILFTEDLLNIRDSLCSIYEIKNGKQIWYSLPENDNQNIDCKFYDLTEEIL